jgi:peptidyl-prolyl cis-trans isomerase SurA
MRKLILFIAVICYMQTGGFAQEEILMTIGNEKVTRAEFERIYHKNNSSVVYENKSPREYLDLFINFKLKVMEAEALGYDTMSSFINELAGYRDQLAKPYLQDKEQIREVLEETYRRVITDVNASHISLKIPSGATPADTQKVYMRIDSIRNCVLAGQPFEDLAAKYSEDPSAKTNQGNLGWFSAFRMVFPFEDAAYRQQPGQLSMPVKTRFGYHIIRTNAFRPSLGEVMLAHIMVRMNRKADSATHAAAREKIYQCYDRLNKGESFAEVARKYSEDEASAKNGGSMRWIRSGELPVDLEEKVFALSDSGQYSEPQQSDYGYHIFSILEKRPIKSLEEMKPELEEKIARDERQKNTELIYIEKLKKEYGFTEYPENLNMVIGLIDSTLYTGEWNPELSGTLPDPVLTIGKRDYSQLDLVNYIRKEKKYARKESLEIIGRRKYNDFSKDMVLQYEKDQLEDKYPDFRYLMEEYHDGILLFNITDDMVWSKAVKDTAGLQQYYNEHKKLYKWQARADISVYSTKDSSLTAKILALAPERTGKKWNIDQFNAAVCGQDSIKCVEAEDHKWEKGADKRLEKVEWQKGATSVYTEKNKTIILVVNQLLKPQQKQLNEARGLVTADYQNQLEKEWIGELRKKYPVTVREEVFSTIK